MSAGNREAVSPQADPRPAGEGGTRQSATPASSLQVLLHPQNGEIVVERVPSPQLESGGVLVRNAYSLISSGTERSKVVFGEKNLLAKARSRPDLVRQVLNTARREGLLSTYHKVMSRLEMPDPLGYCCAGVVEAVAPDVTEFRVGDRVACAGAGYANHAEVVFIPVNLCVPVPPEVPLDEAAFATLGAIALQGVRQADLRLGETACVIGMGLVGLLAAQFLRAQGCRVIGVDVRAHPLQVARELGVEWAFSSNEVDVGREALDCTGGKGVDAVLITAQSSSNELIELAAKVARDKGRVVVVGALPMDIPREPFYEKELELRLSRSYGPGRYDLLYERHGVDYPYAYVRWTERRNMAAVLDLVARGAVRLQPLITHRKPLAEAPQAYGLLKQSAEPVLAILLQYGGKEAAAAEKPGPAPTPARADRVDIGVIGAGNFAQAYRLPYFKQHAASLGGIATRQGHHAAALRDKLGFRFAATDPQQVIEDPAVSSVLIATRHDSHARLAEACLRRGKHVFLEKPMALTEEELRSVYAASRGGQAKLMVGYNRRFSEAARLAKQHLAGPENMLIQYRINNTPLPSGHWSNDPQEGGGRILGEACHFVDFLCYLTDSVPVWVAADARKDCPDDMVITVRMADGSVGSIFHAIQGEPELGKERVEVYCGARFALIDDYIRVSLGSGSKTRAVRTSGKGHAECVAAFCAYVEGKSGPPIADDQLFLGALTTLRIPQAAASGARIAVAPADLISA